MTGRTMQHLKSVWAAGACTCAGCLMLHAQGLRWKGHTRRLDRALADAENQELAQVSRQGLNAGLWWEVKLQTFKALAPGSCFWPPLGCVMACLPDHWAGLCSSTKRAAAHALVAAGAVWQGAHCSLGSHARLCKLETERGPFLCTCAAATTVTNHGNSQEQLQLPARSALLSACF